MNKKVIINILKKDFGLMLGSGMDGDIVMLDSEEGKHQRVTMGSDAITWITDKECSALNRIEFFSSNKRQIEIRFFELSQQLDSVNIEHFNFAMNISLKRLRQ